ncbi:hypothetical protein ASE59_13210 [Sphingomonas sp. Leaf10]|nr:hypothetical protein ASE59_13210 [Sphingomonas sp. Leaf10]
MGWQWHGQGEKVLWTVRGTIDGQRVAFALQKFGFTVFFPKDRADLKARVEGQLRAALWEVESYLSDFAEAQVEAGEVVIANHFSEFEDRYRFHRQLADAAHGLKLEPPDDTVDAQGNVIARSGIISPDITQRMNRMATMQREAFFHSTAMIDAYFSCLEHRLVLLRAFTGRPFEPGEVLELLRMRWGDKLKDVLGLPYSTEAAAIIGRMRRIKERIRNPLSHGGVENDKGSIHFHLPRIGMIPANFTRFGDSIRFSVIPVGADGHAEVCETFDALDALLSTGALASPHQFVRWGIDPNFDAAHSAEYAEAIAEGPEGVDTFIEAWSRRWENFQNMDF